MNLDEYQNVRPPDRAAVEAHKANMRREHLAWLCMIMEYATCKNCGKPITFTTDEEQNYFWAHSEQERSMFNPRRENCGLTAEPA